MENKLVKMVSEIQARNKTDVVVEITVTNRCNCNCEYCFEGSHDDISSPAEEERQIKILEDYCKDFDLSKHNRLNVIFWGGEPMMNTKFLFRLIEVSYRYDFVRYMMYSNGLLVDKYEELFRQDFFESIRKRFEIQLSYDGEPHHSLKRKSNKDVIIHTAEMLQERGMHFSFKATLSIDSLSLLPQIWDSYAELYEKFPHVSYSPTIDQTDRDNTDENFEVWKKVLVEILKKERNFIKKYHRPLWVWFSNPGKLVCNLNNNAHMHCDGKLYICHGCQYQEHNDCFCVGRTKDVVYLEQFLNSGFKPSLRHRKCVECSAVACSVCHVNELGKCPDKAVDYKKNWTRILVNNERRCRYFKYFGMMYHVLVLSMLDEWDN